MFGTPSHFPLTFLTMKYIALCLLCLLLPVAVASAVVAGEIKIDADFPGGNIVVEKIDGNTVRLQPDLRDTNGFWFYWSFRIRGAEGRTLNFVFKNKVVGARGPAVSNDDGLTWRWLSDKPDFADKEFQYAFGPDEKEVLFSTGMNYTEKDLNRFLEKHKNNPNLKVETLCRTKKGRNAELLRIPGKGKDADFKVCLVSRHHCCEMMATHTLEGIVETILSDSDDGKWLREHCDFFIVPFVDKDGVEDGDQGKNRKPHDHNRDYTQRIYPTVQAMTEQVPAWQNGKPLFGLDMHCPMLRGGGNEAIHFCNLMPEEIWQKRLQLFVKILTEEKKGAIPAKVPHLVPYTPQVPGLQKSAEWARSLPDSIFGFTIEVPYSNVGGVAVDANTTRTLGRDLARTIRLYLETMDTSVAKP